MAWKQIVCHTDVTHQEIITDAFEAAGAVSVSYQDAADTPIFEPAPGETRLWEDLVITALFPLAHDMDNLLLMLAAHQKDWNILSTKIEMLAEQEWVRTWMDNFHPMQFGEYLWIYPSWHKPPEGSGVKVLLDPGLAFGTGTHPTTALCLAWLGQFPSLAGKTVLDYGCGSGILAIAAAKLGAKRVVATDLDPQALLATNDNTARNAIHSTVIQTCYPDEVPSERFDIVLANILAGPLLQLAPALIDYVATDGHLVLSGILATQSEQIRTAYAHPHLSDLHITQSEDWVRAVGHKR